MLLLVVYLADASSGRAGFKSHMFTNQANGSAQLAAIDALRDGAAYAHQVQLQLQTNGTVTKELPSNEVVNVNPGAYVVRCMGQNGGMVATRFLAEAGGAYVLLHVGRVVGLAVPERLVAFPGSV